MFVQHIHDNLSPKSYGEAKFVEKVKTHILWSVFFFLDLMSQMEKTCLQPEGGSVCYRKMDLEVRKKLVKCCIWIIVLYGA
jgi:hypothetical protein